MNTMTTSINPLCVLVVEDDFLIRTCLAEHLTDSDIHVLEAENCAEAINHFNATTRIDVVVTDISLPDGNGEALSRDMRARCPTLPVIFTTGQYAMTQNPSEAHKPYDRVIAKPYTLSAVLEVIRELTTSARDCATQP